MDERDFFEGRPGAWAIHCAVDRAVQQLGPSETRVSKSQIAFYRTHPFAATWTPGRHLKGKLAPLVVSVYLRRRDPSPRWKEVVEPAPGRFTHHRELNAEDEVDEELKSALKEAWRDAG
jgi:hypothetical protein